MKRGHRRGVLFRADASESIGTGHLVRCQAMAAEFLRRDYEPWLASRELGDGEVQTFDSRHVLRLAGDRRSEADEIGTHEPISSMRPLVGLVLDNYGLGREWLVGARKLSPRRLVIDDLANRPLPCEVL